MRPVKAALVAAAVPPPPHRDGLVTIETSAGCCRSRPDDPGDAGRAARPRHLAGLSAALEGSDPGAHRGGRGGAAVPLTRGTRRLHQGVGQPASSALISPPSSAPRCATPAPVRPWAPTRSCRWSEPTAPPDPGQSRLGPAKAQAAARMNPPACDGRRLCPAGRQASWFSATDDPAARQFYTLDPQAIGAALGVADPAPFILVALGPAPPESIPARRNICRARRTTICPMSITWYGLAVALRRHLRRLGSKGAAVMNHASAYERLTDRFRRIATIGECSVDAGLGRRRDHAAGRRRGARRPARGAGRCCGTSMLTAPDVAADLAAAETTGSVGARPTSA